MKKLTDIDLRKGNFVALTEETMKHVHGDLGIFVKIDENYHRSSEIGSHSLSLTVKGQVYEFDYHEIQPIPFIDKWPQRLGFSGKEYKKEYIGIDVKSGNGGMTTDFVLTKPFVMGEWQKHYVYELMSNRFVAIEYVHDIQNLFHSICGVDLPVLDNEQIKLIS